MRTTTLSVIVRCFCVLLIFHGLVSNVSASGGRILHGNFANPVDYQFMVHLMYADPATDWHCAGSVISYHFILTAAHCIYQRECVQVEISPSTWELGVTPSYYASECHIHEMYDSQRFFNDIALVQTEENLLANNQITLIGLPDAGTVNYDTDTLAQIAGWGLTETEEYPDTLLQATVRIYDRQLCNQMFYDTGGCGTDEQCAIPHEAFCTAGDFPNPPGPCDGDSGGPVLIKGKLAGVMSIVLMDNGACVDGTPSLHMKVVDYIPWIETHVDL